MPFVYNPFTGKPDYFDRGIGSTSITNPQSGEVLIYDGSSWVNSTISGAEVDVSDIDHTLIQNIGIYSHSEIDAKLDNLEDSYVKDRWFEQVGSGTGRIDPPEGGTFILDQWPGGVDAVVSTISSGTYGVFPEFEHAYDSEGNYVTTSLDSDGNFILSNDPISYPIAIIYSYRIKRSDYDYTKSLFELEIDEYAYLNKVSGNDLTAGYLSDNIIADTGVSTSISGAGYDEKLLINLDFDGLTTKTLPSNDDDIIAIKDNISGEYRATNRRKFTAKPPTTLSGSSVLSSGGDYYIYTSEDSTVTIPDSTEYIAGTTVKIFKMSNSNMGKLTVSTESGQYIGNDTYIDLYSINQGISLIANWDSTSSTGNWYIKFDSRETVQEIVVSPQGGEFNSVEEAVLFANTYATVDNPYMITIKPGDYTLASGINITNSYLLSIMGSNMSSVRLLPSESLIVQNTCLIDIGSDTSIYGIAIDALDYPQAVTTSGFSAISFSNVGYDEFTSLFDITIKGFNKGINFNSPCASYFDLLDVRGCQEGIHVGTGSQCYGNRYFTNDIIDKHIHIDGTGVYPVNMVCTLFRLASLTTHSGTGIYIEGDNATAYLSSGIFQNLEYDVKTFDDSIIEIQSSDINQATYNTIEQYDTSTISIVNSTGYFPYDKMYIENPSSFYINSFCNCAMSTVIGNMSDTDQELIIVNIGESSNPVLKYKSNYIDGYKTLLFNNDNYGVPTAMGVESQNEEALLIAYIEGTNALNHKAYLKLYSEQSGVVRGWDIIKDIGTTPSLSFKYNDTTESLKLNYNGTINLNSGVSVNKILDDDTMASDDSYAIATQQSIKAYVDNNINTHNHDSSYYTETELDSGQLDDRYYTESEVDYMFTTNSGNLISLINSKSDIGHDHTSEEITYTNSFWQVNNVKEALDDSLYYLETTNATGRIKPEEVLTFVGTTVTVHSGTGFITYENFSRRYDWEDTNIDFSSGYTTGSWYIYIDTTGDIKISDSYIDPNRNIVFGTVYINTYEDTIIGYLGNSPTWLDTSSTRTIDSFSKMGAFIYEEYINDGKININNDLTWDLNYCKVQYGPLSLELTARDESSFNLPGITSFLLYNTVEGAWKGTYSWGYLDGLFPTNIWNDTTQSGFYLSEYNYNFTSYSNIITVSGVDLTSLMEMYNQIHYNNDPYYTAAMISGVSWDGNETTIALFGPYLGSTISGSAYIDKCLRKIPDGYYGRYDTGRTFDDKFYITVDDAYYENSSLAESGGYINIPTHVGGALVRSSEIITQAGVDYTEGIIVKDIDRRPLPFGSVSTVHGVTDHGQLYGLSDDDHPQYLTTARADSRYYTESEIDTLSGTLSNSYNTIYNNTGWNITDAGTALDDLTTLAEDLLGSGRVYPENPLSVSGTNTLVVSGGYGYINYTDFHKHISWNDYSIDTTGFSESIYYVYVDTNGDIYTSVSNPGYSNNIILGTFYHGGNRIGVVTNYSCVIDAVTNRAFLFAERLGTFIYDDGGLVQLMAGNDRRVVSTACKAQNAFVSYDLSEVSSDDIGTHFICYYKTPDLGWETDYYFILEDQGTLPIDRYNNTTASGATVSTDCTFTNGSNIITCTSNITSEVDEFDYIYLTSDTAMYMNLVSGTNWTGTQTDITLYDTYKGSSSTGEATLIKAFDSIPTDYFAKHLLGRTLDNNMYLIPGQALYSSLVDAQAAPPPEIPSALSEIVIRMAYVYTTPASGTLLLEDIRPLPFHKTTGGRQTSSQAVTYHGDLSGLTNDDHPQYILSDGSRDFNSIVGYISHPSFSATTDIVDKKYVDDTVITDHGDLTGLSDDDHSQYTLANGNRDFSAIVSYDGNKIFNSDTNLISKKYVDDSLAYFTVDHGELDGLSDDDHPQYMTISGSRSFTNKVSYDSNYTFTSDTDIVDKLYVDSSLTTAYTNVLYVDKLGNDTTGDGTLIKPYLTVQAAIDNSLSTDLIFLNPGTYTEDINISSQVTLTSMCPTKTIIVGKATFTNSTTNSVRQIQFQNTNDHAIVFNSSSDTGILSITNCIVSTTWNSSTGQTADTCKSSIKLERGIYNQFKGKVLITTSSDNYAEHNTAAYWLSGTNKVDLTVYNVYNSVSNTTDSYQNIMAVFNNNSNSSTEFRFKNGFMFFNGVSNSGNYMAPFYNLNSSASLAVVEGNYIKISDSGNCYTAFNYNSSTKVTFTNNTIAPDNVTTIYAAYENGTGSIDVINCFFDTSTMPSISGDVDYVITLNDGKLYTSDSVYIGNSLTLVNGASVDSILDEDDMSSDSVTAIATQQSIKSYVDNTVDTELTTLSGALQNSIDALENYDVPVCQVRRTTNYTLTTSYSDITFDTTDIESDTNTLEHDDSNTDRIIIKQSGYYMIYYKLQIEASSTYTYSRVLLNDTSVIDGSESEVDTYNGEVHPLTATLYVNLQENDYISLQAYTSGTCTAHDDTLLLIASIKGPRGDVGPAGANGLDGSPGTGSTINISEDGSLISSLVSNLNFTGGLTVTSGTTYTTVNVTDSVFQAYSSIATSLNNSTPVAISWDNEIIKDTGYTHSNTSNSSRVYVDSSGWYEINYNILMDSDGTSRTMVRGRVRKNGTTYISIGSTCNYTRNITNDLCNISPGQFLLQLDSGDYIEVLCDQQGDSSATYNVADSSHIYLKLIRYT